MGLFSKLLGLESAEIYEATFVFARHDLRYVNVEIKKSRQSDNYVEWTTYTESALMGLLAFGHWAKNMYNLGNDHSAYFINQTIGSLWQGNVYHEALELPSSKPDKYPINSGITWRTILCKNRHDVFVPNTKVPFGGDPSVMAPASVLALIDCVKRELHDKKWRLAFLVGLRAISTHYEKNGHTDVSQITIAMDIGLAAMLQAEERLEEEGV